MDNHRYILDKSSRKFYCPECNKKRFVRYVDTTTNEYLPNDIGRCDRQCNCSCWNKPALDKSIKNINSSPKQYTPQKAVSFIDPVLWQASLKNYESNHFVQYLISLFGNDIALQLVSKYFIGTSNNWHGANIFWQIDNHRKVRTGKMMLYSPTTGKRIKEPHNHIAWVHKAVKQPEFELSQCLFGAHLLNDSAKPISLCESEKTAIIASVYYPQFNWVASGGADGLSVSKCESLNKHGKPVVLWPDLSTPKEGKQSTFEKWQAIAKAHLLKYTFSTKLESIATEVQRNDGLDLADYLIQFDYKEFIQHEPQSSQQSVQLTPFQPLIDTKVIEQVQPIIYFNKPTHTQNWQLIINELESYFASIEIPTHTVKLNCSSSINDCILFIENHLTTIKAHNGNRTFLPYLNRLKELQNLLTAKV